MAERKRRHQYTIDIRSAAATAIIVLLAMLGAQAQAKSPLASTAVQTTLPLSISTPSAHYIGSGLTPGQEINANQYLLSGNGQYELDMLPTGVGVLWAKLPNTQPCPMWIFPPPTNNVVNNNAWTLQATPAKGDFLIMQTDGNFVEYNSAGTALWASNTANKSGATLSLQSDGNLVIYLNSTAIWTTSSNNYRGPVLCKGNVLQALQGLVQSAMMYNPVWVGDTNTVGAYHLLVSSSGKLEMLSALSPHTFASGPAGSYLIMQDDGNLVFYPPNSNDQAGKALWATGTSGNPGAVAMVSNWGDLWVINPQTWIILYDSSNKSEGQTIGESAKLYMNP